MVQIRRCGGGASSEKYGKMGMPDCGLSHIWNFFVPRLPTFFVTSYVWCQCIIKCDPLFCIVEPSLYIFLYDLGHLYMGFLVISNLCTQYITTRFLYSHLYLVEVSRMAIHLTKDNRLPWPWRKDYHLLDS